MSETEPVLEPVPVTKEAPAVNGNDDDLELPPPDPELQNGVNKHNGDMEVENGVIEDYGLNGDKNEQSAPAPVPVNGGYEGADDAEDNDIEGVDELPPPPEIVPDLPPPPEVCEQPPSENQDPFESSVDPAVESSVDPAVESSVDPDQDVGEIDCVDENEDLMNVSDSECPDESVPPPCVEPPRPVDDVSEEELVSDGGLKEEVDVEIQNNQQNESVEQMNEGQLVDVSEPIPQDIESVPVQEVEPVNQVPPPMEPSAPLIDVGEPAYEPESPAEPVVSPASPMESEIPDIPVVPVVPEVAVEAEVQPVSEPEVETLPEPVPVVKVATPEPEPVIEDPAPEPDVDDSVFEPPSEPEVPVSQPEPVVVVEPEVPAVQEPEPVQIQEPVAAPVIPQIGLSEPDIIIDNKPVEQEVEQPPPPPPPLEEETPVPPPPLDDNIPLRRVSGSSSPNKQSPSKELDSPVALAAPVSVAVVAPQPEPIEPELEVQVAQEPVPVPEPVSPPSYTKEEPVLQPPTQPIAVVAPQMVSDNVSPGSSPPASPGATSQTSPSEGDKAEAQPVTSPQVSQKINKKNFKNKIKFGIDLVEATLKQLNFLHSVNKHPGLYEEWLFRKAIRRYESFWLPMAAQHKKESLAAPLDIEWVWHCHMLAPLAYEADCKALVGLVVEHKVMNEKDRTKSLEKSRKYWTAKYPNEPFEIELVYKEKVVEPEPVPEPVAADTNQDKPNDTVEEKPSENTGEDVKEADTTEEAPVTEDAAPTTDDNNTTTEPAVPVEPVLAEPTPAPEPVEPVIPEEGYEQKTTYNIFSAIGRQRVFYYQTCLSHYHDKHFLKAAQKRYQRFLFLKHQNPLEFLVPCYDIDVMWHSHQLHPSVYKHDTVKVLGQILAHDDSVNDRSAGSRLVSADQRTRELWKEHFGDNFMTFGAMFRGDPPVLCERMSVIEPVETYTFSTKKATVNLDKVQVEGLPEEVNKYSVKLAYEGYDEKEGPMIKQFKGNKKKIEFENAKKGLAHFVFDTKEYERIRFDMHQHMGFACAGHDEEIGQQIFHLMPVVENIPMNKEDASNLVDTVTIDDEHNLKATFTATIEPPKQGPTMLYMNPGNYEQRFCIMPEQIVQMWGPVPLPRLPTGKDNNCLVASHKLVNHTGEVTFTCRVIHSLPLLMSAIQVFFHARMTAVAHLVGSDQIPLPSQLSEPKKVFSLNPGDDQRALVIKNQHGDWGLIRGQWTGFRKHQPAVAATKGKKAKKEVPWSPGTLSVSFYKCSSGAWQHLTLPYAQENFKFNIQEASIDLKTGTIEIQSESNEVAENLALGFSVALLHVLCQPRYQPPAPPEPIPVTVEPPPPSPKEPEAPKAEEEKPAGEPATQEGAEGESSEATKPAEAEEEKPQEPPATPKTPKSPAKSEPPTPSKKVKEVPPIPTCELGLVLAAGFNVDTPTTEHIKRQYGANACAGCCAVGVDIGVGIYGNVADAEVMEAAEGGDVGDVDNVAGDNGDAGDQDVGSGGEGGADIDTDAAGMDCMGDIGDAGAAACGAF